MRRRRLLALAGASALSGLTRAAPQADTKIPVVVAMTAEFGLLESTSAQAIEQGVRLAIAEINAAGGVLGGRSVRLVTRDDRSIPARAVRNFQEFLQVPNLVAVFGGKFSPVLLELEPLARQANVPLLAPWSAADYVTAGREKPAVVFRLALKDSWAMKAMARYLVERRGVRTIGLLVPNTAWGRSSVEALYRLAVHAPLRHHVQWYSWGEKTLLPQYQALRAAGADGIILVANEREGALMLREMAALPPAQRLPVAAHTGVTGGDLFGMAGPALAAVDLSIVQTFTFTETPTPLRKHVFRIVSSQPAGVPVTRVSAVGFAHAYDLMHLLGRALQRAGSTDGTRVREALESLGTHEGLVKTYRRPFANGQHEALSFDDAFMARFTRDGRLVRIGRE